ncbi:MAG: Hsp20/alpha crystallin family protein, partial [Bdellovibrionales bacterium]|nr:Hsp20/alpha crystallin family protein [Bdellovibrionales bacterium]
NDWNSMLRDFFSEGFFPSAKIEGGDFSFVPVVNFTEDEQKFEVSVELPGMKEEDFEVTLGEKSLSISGEKRQKHEKKEGDRTYFESSYGRFERIVPLPALVNADKIDAKFENGVLHVVLPKAEEVRNKTRKVSVRKG